MRLPWTAKQPVASDPRRYNMVKSRRKFRAKVTIPYPRQAEELQISPDYVRISMATAIVTQSLAKVLYSLSISR